MCDVSFKNRWWLNSGLVLSLTPHTAMMCFTRLKKALTHELLLQPAPSEKGQLLPHTHTDFACLCLSFWLKALFMACCWCQKRSDNVILLLLWHTHAYVKPIILSPLSKPITSDPSYPSCAACSWHPKLNSVFRKFCLSSMCHCTQTHTCTHTHTHTHLLHPMFHQAL